MKKQDEPLLSSLLVEPAEDPDLMEKRLDSESLRVKEEKTGGKKILDTIEKAGILGAEKITILCRESVPVSSIEDLIEHTQHLKMTAEAFLSPSLITADFARYLFNRGVETVLQKENLEEHSLTGLSSRNRQNAVFHAALAHLHSAGYPSENASLAVHAPVTRENLKELKTLWKQAGDAGIVPILEVMPPSNGDIRTILPEPADIQTLFEELARTDAMDRNLHWEPCHPVAGPFIPSFMVCPVLTSNGEIHPLKGLPIPLGNIHKTALENILKDSEVLENLKDRRRKIKGPCRKCEKADRCFGSRPISYLVTGDYMASDPLCWKNTNKADQITYLPVPADLIIPQQSPMRLVSSLIEVKERHASVQAVVDEASPLAGENGVLEEVALFEMMAQAAAAVNGFEEFDTGLPPHRGALLGGRNISITGPARTGELLIIRVYKKASFGSFGVLGATVEKEGTILARGDIKVFKESI